MVVPRPGSDGAWEPEPQAAGSGEAVLQREGHVADTGALIFGHDDDALPVAVGEPAEADLAALGVHQDVARDFRDGGGDDRLVADFESAVGGQLPSLLPRADDVDVRPDWNRGFVSHDPPAPCRGG